MDQGSNKNHSPAYNFTPTVTKFCVMWEGLSLPHDTKFGNCRCKIVDSRSFHSWSLIHGLRWSGLIKVGPGVQLSMRRRTGNKPLSEVIMSLFTGANMRHSVSMSYTNEYLLCQKPYLTDQCKKLKLILHNLNQNMKLASKTFTCPSLYFVYSEW